MSVEEYYIDETIPLKIKNFCAKYLIHTDSPFTGKPFILLDWQYELLKNLFGSYNKRTGLRKHREAYVEIPRKNGKSTLIAAIALYFLICGDIGEEVAVAASTREQASFVYKFIDAFIKNNRKLQENVIVYKNKTIICPNKRSRLLVLSRDADSANGLNTSLVICDELHTFPDDLLHSVLRRGMGARPNGLLISITTAGYNKNSFCYQKREYAEAVNSGLIDDPTFYSVIYGLRDGDDWKDEKVWYKCNPSLGHTLNIETFRSDFKQALNSKVDENSFKILSLNSWTSDVAKFIPLETLNKCYNKGLSIADFKGEPCFAALDLSSTLDLTGLSFTFYRDSKYYNFSYAFIPEETMRERIKKEKVCYDMWQEAGYVIATAGDVVDYQRIIDKIEELKTEHNLKIMKIGFDRWGSTHISKTLENMGYEVAGIGQGFASMSTPTKNIQIAIQRQDIYFNNPVTIWCFSNAQAEIDKAENIKLIKTQRKKNVSRIDLAISSIMAYKMMSDYVLENGTASNSDLLDHLF